MNAADESGESRGVTEEEAKAIRSLKRLARTWPKTLELLSMNGTLCIVHTGDPRLNDFAAADRNEAVLATVQGIPNDGGDW